jgi:hypothetical protein
MLDNQTMEKKTKLSLSTNDTTMSIEFDNWDIDLDQYFQAFKTLLVGVTFTEEQIDHWIIDEGEVLASDKEIDRAKSNLF